MTRSFLLQLRRVQVVLLLKWMILISIYSIGRPPPSSPQQPQPIDEQEDISSILEGIPLLSQLPPDVTDVTSMSSGEEMNTSPPDSHGIIKYFNDDPMIPI